MIQDKELMVSSAQAVTAAAGSTDYIDTGAAANLGVVKDLHMCITVDETVTAAGAATVDFQLQCDSDSAFGSPKTVLSSKTFGKAELTAGRAPIFLPIPSGLDERYVRVYYNVGTGPLTAGKFTAGIVQGVDFNKAYPDAL